MAKELSKKPMTLRRLRKKVYQEWIDGGYFHAEVDETKKPFTVVIPPPNVTGQLHMGHALDETFQDIIIRNQRECRDIMRSGFRGLTMQVLLLR